MAEHRFQANETWVVGIDAAAEKGFRTLAYSTAHSGGTLGGGTLQLRSSHSANVASVPLADAKLSAAKVDDNGDVIKQITFQASGNLEVVLSGATAPDVWVSVI